MHGLNFTGVHADLWSATGSLLKNAFIRALLPTFETKVKLKEVDTKVKEKEVDPNVKAKDVGKNKV